MEWELSLGDQIGWECGDGDGDGELRYPFLLIG